MFSKKKHRERKQEKREWKKWADWGRDDKINKEIKGRKNANETLCSKFFIEYYCTSEEHHKIADTE